MQSEFGAHPKPRYASAKDPLWRGDMYVRLRLGDGTWIKIKATEKYLDYGIAKSDAGNSITKVTPSNRPSIKYEHNMQRKQTFTTAIEVPERRQDLPCMMTADDDAALRCLPSTCTPDMCSHHKTTSFPCANAPLCKGTVKAVLNLQLPEYLDNESAERTVDGVFIDGRVYARRRNAIASDQLTVESNRHAYLCAACSAPLLLERPWRPPNCLRQGKMDAAMQRTNALVLNIPTSISMFYGVSSTPGGARKHYHIRPLGPKCTADILSLQAEYREQHDVHCAWFAKDALLASQLPVKNYSTIPIDEAGMEAHIDKLFYALLLGVFDVSVADDSVLVGFFELNLDNKQVTSKRQVLVCDLNIENVFFRNTVDMTLMCLKVVGFSLAYTRLLKSRYNTDVHTVSLTQEPHLPQMDTAALAYHFQLLWYAHTPPYKNVWVRVLRESMATAARAVQDQVFFPHLPTPMHAVPQRPISFAFKFRYNDQLHTSVHHSMLPSCSIPFSASYRNGAHQMYSILEQENRDPADTLWMQQQVAFFSALNQDDILTLASYSQSAFLIVNTYMTRGTLFVDASKSIAQRFCFAMDARQYIIFQPQLLAVKGVEFRVQGVQDLERIVHILASWSIEEWRPVLQAYVNDITRLYESAPPLEKAMTTYRGEQIDNTFGRMVEHPASVEREFSFTLDACVAVAFARNPLGATVYKVIWQPGSKLILLAGLESGVCFMEVEVRVMSPRFNTADMSSRRVVVRYPDPASRLPRNPLPDLVDTYEIVTMTACTW